jgi:truncated hemoglobin YjbI
VSVKGRSPQAKDAAQKVAKLIPHWQDGEKFEVDTRRLKHRLGYFHITPEDADAINTIHEIIDPMIYEIVEVFYAQIGNFNNLNRIILEHSSPERLKKTFRRFVLEMGVNIDTVSYAESRLRVGGFGLGLVKTLSTIYPGYAPTFTGTVIGGIWGLVCGFICGAVVALIYNFLQDHCAKSN